MSEVLGFGFIIGCWVFGHHLRLVATEIKEGMKYYTDRMRPKK